MEIISQGKEIRGTEFQQYNGMKVVTEIDNDTLSPIGNISRKVMLSPH